MHEIDQFIDGYIEAALWADCQHEDPDAESGDGQHLTMSYAGRAIMATDCDRFCRENAADLALYCEQRAYDPSQGSAMSYAGHDFWLTRNGHGAGFWDRDLGALGDRLTAAAEAFGECNGPFDCGDGTADIDGPVPTAPTALEALARIGLKPRPFLPRCYRGRSHNWHGGEDEAEHYCVECGCVSSTHPLSTS